MGDEGVSTPQALQLHNELHVMSISQSIGSGPYNRSTSGPPAFLYWDHFITFDDEARLLWKKKAKTRSTYYFFLNRYLAFFGDIAVTVFQFTPMPLSVRVLTNSLTSSASPFSMDQWCKHINLFRQLLLIFNQCIVCVLMTLRIYALYGLDKRLYISMLGFGSLLLAVSCWALIRKSGDPEPNAIGCHIAISQEIVYQAVPWDALFIYDIAIFGALFYKSFQTRRESQMMWGHNAIMSLLIRDGAIYFVVMALVNLANIITYYKAGPLLRGCLSTMASCMSVTMTSRLMLNLHSMDRRGVFSNTSRLSLSDTPPHEDLEDIQLDTLRTQDLERSAHVVTHVSPES